MKSERGSCLYERRTAAGRVRAKSGMGVVFEAASASTKAAAGGCGVAGSKIQGCGSLCWSRTLSAGWRQTSEPRRTRQRPCTPAFLVGTPCRNRKNRCRRSDKSPGYPPISAYLLPPPAKPEAPTCACARPSTSWQTRLQLTFSYQIFTKLLLSIFHSLPPPPRPELPHLHSYTTNTRKKKSREL